MKLTDLSPRRRQVAELVAQRLSRLEIAQSLHCAESTVDAHIAYLSTRIKDHGFQPQIPAKGMRLIRLWLRAQAA